MAKMASSSKKIFSVFLLFVLASVAMVIFDGSSLLRSLRAGTEKILLPTQFFIYQRIRPLTNIPKDDFSSREKERKIAILEAQILDLEKENSDMRRLLGAPLPSSWRFLPAKVVGIKEGTLLVDKGKSDSVKLGQVAIFDNVFVGLVSSQGEYLLKLKTPSSPNFKIPVVVKSPDLKGISARGLLSFQGGKIILDRVLPQEKITEGDLVLTAGTEDAPSDLLIGKITKLEKKPALFQKGEIQPLVSYHDLKNVFLIIFK